MDEHKDSAERKASDAREEAARRPYAPPAIVQEATLDVIALGASPAEFVC